MSQPSFLQKLRQIFKHSSPGVIGAIVAFVIALLWVIFGFFKLLFIIIMTALGYYVGARYFSDRETVRRWLDKLFPPGKFR